MKINEIIGEWIIMPQSIKPMGLIRKSGGGFDFKNKGNNRANEAPIEQDKNNPVAKPYVDMPEWKALHDMDDKIIDAYIKHKEVKEADEVSIPRILGKAEASLTHGLEMADAVLKKDHDLATVQARVIKENWPPLINQIKNVYNTHEVTEDETTSSAQWSLWRKKNPMGRNFMDPDDYDSDSPGEHIIAYNPNQTHFYKVPAENYDKAFDLWLDSRGSDPKDSQYYDSTKDYASEQDYWGRIAPKEEEDPEFEDAMGVGTITKQNTTQDVKPGETQRQAKKLHLR